MPIKLKANNGNIDLQVPIKNGAVSSVNGQVGDVVLDIPSKTSQLQNDSGFLTEHQSLAEYAKKSEIPDVSGFITEIPDEYVTETELDAKGYLTEHQSLAEYAKKSELFSKDYNDLTNKPTIPSIDGLATKLEVKEVEDKIPSLNGYATEQWVEGKGYLTQHQSLADYATKSELDAKQDTLTAGTNITIENGVISASGGSSGSDIKSIKLNTLEVDINYIDEYKELLTYLWGTGKQGNADLTKCIVTVDGVLINKVYVSSPYIYFYPTVSSKFTSDGLSQHFYICDYTKAMTASGDYIFINMVQYPTTLLTSDNYSQYISASGNYTTDASDSNLYNAVELYICIYSGSNYAFLYIKPQQNLTFSSCTYQNYAYSINNTVHSLYYDGNNLVINDGVDDNIQFIWYK